ncbi:MAG: hypothetical protein LVQ97_05120 [Candidatus Micrarchaeales archaeon]|uniref:Biotin/lipoate A/B protein ligase n=1 Tax=Candidatus Micrarchaeum acidiphilum ARMAN-2 TaxID=425595 RepID=C7DGR3_MICA2|nr:MAG: biotin/lipoate A/B protein ligase [Candidatus Micrarchaeum acidiphilum ARMAN-2]MCW6161538.1 hypothetical protein [Candidatus Micrarchaeales archaeon]
MFDYEYFGTGTFSISENMALEELMLDESARRKVATIRFWNVEKDAAVIGYGESKSNIRREDGSFDIARRITGGSHVQFDSNCLAYTFTVPRDGSFRYFNDMRKFFADKVAASLAELGVDDVEADNKASTINVGGKVIASHAIFWGTESALMHGLMLVNHYNVDEIFERMLLKERKIGKHSYSEYGALKSMPVAANLMAGKVREEIPKSNKIAYVKKMLSEQMLKEIAGDRYKSRGVGPSDIAKAMLLASQRHVGTPWIENRSPSYTDSEVEAIPGEELSGKLKKDLGYCMYIEVPDKDFAKMTLPEDEM